MFGCGELNTEFLAVPKAEGKETVTEFEVLRMWIGKTIFHLLRREVHAQTIAEIIFQSAKGLERIAGEELYQNPLFVANGETGIQVEEYETDFLLMSGGGKEGFCTIHGGLPSQSYGRPQHTARQPGGAEKRPSHRVLQHRKER